MVLITDLNSLWIKRRNTVSVPLRGLWFLSFMVLVGLDTISHLVSVPLRGLWFLSCRKRANKKWIRESFRPLAGIMVLIKRIKSSLKKRYLLFPSPCGDYGSYLVRDGGTYMATSRGGFRPLAGIMVLINEMLEGKTFPCPVSVPLRGLWFLSAHVAGRQNLDNFSFRPLAGIMVLIAIKKVRLCVKSSMSFPSPCGDYGSYRRDW